MRGAFKCSVGAHLYQQVGKAIGRLNRCSGLFELLSLPAGRS